MQQKNLFDGPHSDMSLALGIGETSVSRTYQGWYSKSPMNFWWTIWGPTEYQKWTRLEWEELANGESLYDALMYVISQQTEFGIDDPVNNYRSKGQGNLADIRLSGN